jgi:hypothetical protein
MNPYREGNEGQAELFKDEESYYSTKDIDEVAKYIWDAAKQQRLVTYEEISGLGCYHIFSDELKCVLNEINRDTQEFMGILLSAIVVDSTDGVPWNNFFSGAENLYRGVGNKLTFWAREIQRVFERAKRGNG